MASDESEAKVATVETGALVMALAEAGPAAAGEPAAAAAASAFASTGVTNAALSTYVRVCCDRGDSVGEAAAGVGGVELVAEVGATQRARVVPRAADGEFIRWDIAPMDRRRWLASAVAPSLAAHGAALALPLGEPSEASMRAGDERAHQQPHAE